jgi:nicotinate-nucleotide adenylyltransferase
VGIGIFGGTFDPIHLGHLIVVEEVRARLGFNEIIFVPTGQPWLKADRAITLAAHRVEMVRLAIASNPYFVLSTVEVDRAGPSYSVDTIAILQRQFGAEARLFFILGSDAISSLPRWKDPRLLIQMCWLVTFTRPESSPPDLVQLESAIPGISSRTTLVKVPQISISSSQIRSRVASGLPICYHVPEAVERYILGHGLYRPL